MKKLLSLLLMAALLLCLFEASAFALVEEHPALNAAFSMLEEGNIFLRRYNELTGADVKPVFENGMPYYFGGQDSIPILQNAPMYTKITVGADTGGTKFFRVGKTFIRGFDCSGFTKWICRQSGLNEFGDKGHPGLQSMILDDVYKENNHIFSGGTKAIKLKNKPMPAYDKLKDTLIIGDMLVSNDGSRHIMMYIGTLRDYGFTAEEVPELADYLDYPLVIHDGPSPVAGERFQKFIDNNSYYSNCNTTNGCVNVSIVGDLSKVAPNHIRQLQKKDYDFFWIDDGKCPLTVRDLTKATSFCWFRVHAQ